MVIFVVPAYNEAENILTLLKETDKKMVRENLPYKMIIIDDGSTDDTVKMVESQKSKMPVEVYSHYPNKGVGAAFRLGLLIAAQTQGSDNVIITKEADNTSNLDIIGDMLDKIKSGYDLVLASCYSPQGAVKNTTFLRMFLSKCANSLLRLFFPIKGVFTYSSFYRAYRPDILKKAFDYFGDKLIEENGFSCMVELLIKLYWKLGCKVTEVPLVLDGSRRTDKSKMKVSQTIIHYINIIIRLQYLKRQTKNDTQQR